MDTPAWQSFEVRMRARAAERRRARRQRRIRRLTYALAAVFALAMGVLSALAWQQVRQRVVWAERAMARQPIIVEWPPPPAPPPGMKAAGINALPIPPDWAGTPQVTEEGTEAEPAGSTGSEDAEPTPAAPALASAQAPAATPDRPTGTSDRRSQPAETSAASSASSTAAASREREPRPTGVAPLTSGSVARNRTIEPPPPGPEGEGLSRPVPQGLGGGLPRESEPAPASQPPVGTLGRLQPSEPPAGAGRTVPPVTSDAPAASPAAVRAAATARVDPREGVRTVLERYRSAYQRLDASAARAVWPGVDAGALSRAFSAISSQELWFEGCAIDVSGSTADATCTGQARIVPKIGGGSETARRTWQFKLRQSSGSGWVIDKATVK